jgi:N-acetylglucosaminyldiphosphoundecaprenol N-acetyl-beta-D-mannosaminyltransferase
MPLIWASRLQGTPLPARVAGSDLIWSLTERAAREGCSVFLLGGNPGAAEAAAAEFTRRFPALRVAGHYCPPVGFENDPVQAAAIDAMLAAARPDIVYVGLGAPKQERLITRLRPLLPAAWFLGIGISFSFVTGEVRRAPRWMQVAGLEWAHRLVQEPRRLAKRYLVHGLPFAAKLLAVSAWRGVRRRGGSYHPSGESGS